MIIRMKPKALTIVRRPQATMKGIGAWLYTPEEITEPQAKSVYDEFSKRSAENIADATERWGKFRTHKELAMDFAKSLSLANTGVEMAGAFLNTFFFRKSMPSEKKDEIKKIQADLVEANSYWQTQARTKPTAVSRPGERQRNQALAPYLWMDWAVKYNMQRDASWEQVIGGVKNAPGDVLAWAGQQVSRGLKEGIGLDLPDSLKKFFKYLPYVALGIGGVIVYAVVKPYAATLLPASKKGEARP